MKTLAMIALAVSAAGVLVARPGGRGSGADGACPVAPGATASLSLSAPAVAALRFQIDEERMAGELYRALGTRWALPPFQNIPRAEASHHRLLLDLATRAGLVPDAPTTAGRYETAAVQARHDALLARGATSLIEALRVGALVEEQDIADLRALAASTDSAELKAAARALEQGSQHHLRAFVRNLRARGVDYAAQVLTPAELAAFTGPGGR